MSDAAFRLGIEDNDTEDTALPRGHTQRFGTREIVSESGTRTVGEVHRNFVHAARMRLKRMLIWSVMLRRIKNLLVSSKNLKLQ